ncbi:MAG: glycoside hydrolase family 2 protein [Armatimonadota bacterium]
MQKLLSLSALAVLIAVISPLPSDAGIAFKRDFAPQEGLVAPMEKPWRSEVCLNGLWQFQPVAIPKGYDSNQGAPALTPPEPGAWEKTPIKIPSPWNVNSFSESDGGDFKCYPSYPASWEKVDMGWLRRSFKVPASWQDKKVVLQFEAISGDAEVVINGRSVARQFDIFMPLKVDVTNHIKWNADNELLVGVRKPSLFDVPGKLGRYTYPTGSFWGMHIAGIWQDVYLQAVPMLRFDDVFVKPLVDKDRLELALNLRNDTGKPVKVSVSGKAYPWISLAGADTLSVPEPKWRLGDNPALELPSQTVDIAPGKGIDISLAQQVNKKLALWTPDSPTLYGAVVVISSDGKIIDRRYVRFGWRQFGIRGKSLTLNGRSIQAKGDAWHFMGVPQMTRRYAWSWYKALKDANANAVRPHAQVYPRFYLDMADEMGIMVLDETAIWASHCSFNYDEPVTWERFRSHAEALVLRDRNHPSVFGWSVANEINPALGVSRATAEQVNEINDKLMDIVRSMQKLDPTRPWISSDGDEDMGGRLPTAVGHYGDAEYYGRLSAFDKPYGIGEATCGYYGTPKDAAQFNGDRAYESFLGRMEGVAIDAYTLLEAQRKSAAYCSVFNLAWYGLKPLPIGLKDTGKVPELSDGIFFGKYEEGKPGVQPERLGPYSSTFNPGYDSRLPIYDPWPMFDAIKAAYNPGKPASSPWDHKQNLESTSVPTPDPKIGQVGFIGDTSGGLYFALYRAGVDIVNGAESGDPLLIIDGKAIEAQDTDKLKKNVQSVLSRGDTVLIWGLNKDTLDSINKLIPEPVTLTDRNSVSIVTTGSHPLSANITLSDLYMSDQPFGSLILPQGLDGPFVRKGRVILEACGTDWRRWNDRSENVKTASVVRSEMEAKSSGAALIEMPVGKGRILVCNMDLSGSSPKHMQLTRKFMANLGVKLSEPKAMEGGVFDGSGILKEALVIGSFAGDNFKDAYDTDYLNGERTVQPALNDKVGDLIWSRRSVSDKQLLDFYHMGLPGPAVSSVVYVSFWLYSPRPLDQLLAQPGVPKVDLIAGADDGVKIWLNGNLLAQDFGEHPLLPDQHKCLSMPLKQGWNHFMVKVAQSAGEWQFAARLQCTDPKFMASLKSSVDKPND